MAARARPGPSGTQALLRAAIDCENGVGSVDPRSSVVRAVAVRAYMGYYRDDEHSFCMRDHIQLQPDLF
jgi:hypothetical protein